MQNHDCTALSQYVFVCTVSAAVDAVQACCPCMAHCHKKILPLHLQLFSVVFFFLPFHIQILLIASDSYCRPCFKRSSQKGTYQQW